MINEMKYSWDRRIARAYQLAATNADAQPLLTTYARLLELQRDAALALAHVSLTGGIEQDLHALRSAAHPILTEAATICPLPVVTEIRRLLLSDTAFAAALVQAWTDTTGFTEQSPGGRSCRVRSPAAQPSPPSGSTSLPSRRSRARSRSNAPAKRAAPVPTVQSAAASSSIHWATRRRTPRRRSSTSRAMATTQSIAARCVPRARRSNRTSSMTAGCSVPKFAGQGPIAGSRSAGIRPSTKSAARSKGRAMPRSSHRIRAAAP